MLLTLVIILVLIGSAVVWSIYSNFLVFYENFTETENYHRAQYASTAAVERAELVIKQREPWYVWSWWWILGELSFTWDSPSDQLISGFSYLSNDNTENKSSVFRKINSRTDRIPSEWNGNVDRLLSTDDSLNYNMMDYENAEVFLLYYDNLSGNPYEKRDCSNSLHCIKANITKITGRIRLPQLIYKKFWALDVSRSLSQEWWYVDDALVDWQLRWNFYTWGQLIPFTLFATQSAAWGTATNKDSAIRESNLNNWEWTWLELEFYQRRDPRKHSEAALPTMVSQSSEEIINMVDDNQFNEFFTNNHFSNLQLRLSLLNLVLWQWRLAKRYPFLEYYVDFGNTVSDKYFTIQTEWNFWDYKIDTVLYKPTITESILRSFTTIF